MNQAIADEEAALSKWYEAQELLTTAKEEMNKGETK